MFLLVRIVFLKCQIGISTSKKSIVDNNWFWMEAYLYINCTFHQWKYNYRYQQL